jgi:hypothetical protein
VATLSQLSLADPDICGLGIRPHDPLAADQSPLIMASYFARQVGFVGIALARQRLTQTGQDPPQQTAHRH